MANIQGQGNEAPAVSATDKIMEILKGLGGGSSGAAAISSNPAYQIMAGAYEKAMSAIAEQRQSYQADKALREQKLADQLNTTGRGLQANYKQQINPFGSLAERSRSFGQGTSEFYKNASYASLLQGLSSATQNYNSAVNESNSQYNNLIAGLSGQEADAFNTLSGQVQAQYQFETEQERLRKQAEEDARRWNLQWAAQQPAAVAAVAAPAAAPKDAPVTYVQPQLTFGYTQTKTPSRAVSVQTAAQKAKNKSVIAARKGSGSTSAASTRRAQFAG